jgi:hypothetical protein
MTEAEWLACEDPTPMLHVLRGKTSDRKVVLFSCACVRRIGDYQEGNLRNRIRDLSDFAERYADDLVTLHELRARVTAIGREGQSLPEDPWEWAACHAGNARQHSVPRSERLAILHDIFGNPFRTFSFSPEWRTDTAVSLARQMYDSRGFSAMPILADALQDAGCDSEDILSHCRDTSLTHVRGCWVVDLVLEKS